MKWWNNLYVEINCNNFNNNYCLNVYFVEIHFFMILYPNKDQLTTTN